MSSLPSRLRPWGPELERVGDAFRAGLGPWLPRIERELAEAPPSRLHAEGEVEGFSGICRRGPYERLLLSEWAVLDVSPDEFIRRSTSGEQGFLEMARVRPASSRRWILLFDGGPSQIGAPRLLHLALVLVASARARRHRAELLWGQLQAPPNPRTGIDPVELKVFGRPGFTRGPLESDLWAWLEACDAFSGPAEVWLVGRKDTLLHRETRGLFARVLEVRAPPAFCEPYLEVRECHPGARGQKFELPLPEPALALSILRDPAGKRSRAEALLPERSDGGEPVISAGGEHVFWQSGAFLNVLRLPREENQTAAKVRRLNVAGRVLAVGGRGKTAYVLARTAESPPRLTFYAFDRKGSLTWSEEVAPAEGESELKTGESMVPMLSAGRRFPHRFYISAADERLFELVVDTSTCRLTPWMPAVKLYGQMEGGFWVVRATTAAPGGPAGEDEGPCLEMQYRRDDGSFAPPKRTPFDGTSNPLRVLTEPTSLGGLGCFLARARTGEWRLSEGPLPSNTWLVREEVEVLGGFISRWDRGPFKGHLLQLEPDRVTLVLRPFKYGPTIRQQVSRRVKKGSLPVGGALRLLLELEEGGFSVLSLPHMKTVAEILP